ncbi:MAG: helix-turn-helix transcriptional regulator [Clostridia bacterium]|nr:helix-turn-helix transcriptional regulator [Clostridia bacterium]
MDSISDRIRYLRDKAGYTQTYLAKRLGISRSAVNSWEMSLSSPSVSNIIEMTSLFNVSADYLLSTSDRLTVDITELDSEEREVVIRLVNCLKANHAEKR